jgi:hypothetical protein
MWNTCSAKKNPSTKIKGFKFFKWQLRLRSYKILQPLKIFARIIKKQAVKQRCN